MKVYGQIWKKKLKNDKYWTNW